MRPALKQIRKSTQPTQMEGTVTTCRAEGILVSTDEGEFLAKRAFSCLIEPVPGDRVLVAGDAGTDVYVIAVLERTSAAAATIRVEGDLNLGAPSGRIGIVSAKGIDLATASLMTVTASELTVKAPKGNVFLDHLTYLGSRVFAHAKAFKLAGEVFEAVLDRISHKVKRSYKVVEEIDQVRSSQIDYRADKNMSMRGQNTLISADELVKVDGDQIHLG